MEKIVLQLLRKLKDRCKIKKDDFTSRKIG